MRLIARRRFTKQKAPGTEEIPGAKTRRDARALSIYLAPRPNAILFGSDQGFGNGVYVGLPAGDEGENHFVLGNPAAHEAGPGTAVV